MTPRRHDLSAAARATLDEMGMCLYYVDRGLVVMGDTEGEASAPASMESVEEACAAVAHGRTFRDVEHRFEVFQDRLNAGQGLDMRTSGLVSAAERDTVDGVLRQFGGSGPDVVLDDRTPELVRWERIQVELGSTPDRGGRRSHR